MSRPRKYVIVHFVDNDSAKDAFNFFRLHNPSLLSQAQDFSRVEGNTVFIQEGSFAIPRNHAKEMLMECYGAIPFSG